MICKKSDENLVKVIEIYYTFKNVENLKLDYVSSKISPFGNKLLTLIVTLRDAIHYKNCINKYIMSYLYKCILDMHISYICMCEN